MAANQMPYRAPSRIYLFTHPRTASNLLSKILNLEEQNILPRPLDQNPLSRFQSGNFFRLPTWKAISLNLTNKPASEWTQEETNTIKESYQNCFNDFQAWITEAESQDRLLFVKEHVIFLTSPISRAPYLQYQRSKGDTSENTPKRDYDCPPHPWKIHITNLRIETPSSLNQTILPDDFLLTFKPTFLIRHPALVFPSYYGAHVKTFGTPRTEEEKRELESVLRPLMTFRWLRDLFEFYSSKSTLGSIVLEADDVIERPEIMTLYAKLIRLDSSKLKWEWQPISQDELTQIPGSEGKSYVSTIAGSAGVVSRKISKGLDICAEERKWKDEFGEICGEKMRKWVEAAMPDYEFLRERRLRLGGTWS